MQDSNGPAAALGRAGGLGALVVEHRGEWYAAADRVRLPGTGPVLDVATVVSGLFGEEPDSPTGCVRAGRRAWRTRLLAAGGAPAFHAGVGSHETKGGATLVALQDVSASVEVARPLAAAFWRWLVAALEWRRGPVGKVLVVHRRRPEPVTVAGFFGSKSHGGTEFAPAYALLGDLVGRMPSNAPIYVVHVTDGCGWSPRDERRAAALAARWMHGVSVFACVEAGRDEGPSPLATHLRAVGHPAFRLARLRAEDDVADAVRAVVCSPAAGSDRAGQARQESMGGSTRDGPTAAPAGVAPGPS